MDKLKIIEKLILKMGRHGVSNEERFCIAAVIHYLNTGIVLSDFWNKKKDS